MDLLLTHNYQLIKRLTRLQQVDADSQEMQKILLDSTKAMIPTFQTHVNQIDAKIPKCERVTKNTVEILRFLDQSGVSPEEINTAKEECISRITLHLRNKQQTILAVEYFVQIYIKLMQDRVVKVSYTE